MRAFSAAKQVETKINTLSARTRPRDLTALRIRKKTPLLVTINDGKSPWKPRRRVLTLRNLLHNPSAPLRAGSGTEGTGILIIFFLRDLRTSVVNPSSSLTPTDSL